MIKGNKLNRFNAKDITLRGWVFDQLRTQLNGLSGHLHTFWPDIADSAWIGGKHDSWERVPYWLDGYIPLVYLLKDNEGIKVAKRYIDAIIARQKEDGWLAPGDDREKYDVWGIFIILKALLGYAEITNDENIYKAMYRCLKALDTHLDKYPLFEWAKYRWYECLIIIYAIYKIYQEDWLISLANKLHDQGFDYYSYYKNSFPKEACPKDIWNQENHGVNNMMAVKCYALYSKLTNKEEDYEKADEMLETLNKYHGTVMGNINCDEILAGKDPRRGSEVCSIVELMYSLETLIEISANPKYIDQLNKLAFNALPNGLTNDMWAHQYDTQVNAPFIKRSNIYLWNTNGPESNCYGLEPHFGCCTSNYHQGWPKYVSSAVMYNLNDLYINSYIPLNIKNDKYNIIIDSYYPFKKNILIAVEAKENGSINFYNYGTLRINNEIYQQKGYQSLPLAKGKNRFEAEVIARAIFVNQGDNYYSLEDESLVYALKVKQEKVRINENDPMKALPHGDFEFHNLEPFAYAIKEFTYQKLEESLDTNKSPFVSEKAPVKYLIKCDELSYEITGNYASFLNKVTSKSIIKEFIPIGINKLHIGVLKKEQQQ